MTNPYIPNTSAIPNILFDYWMEKLSPAEFKVLMCVSRKTYGWHKQNDLISLKQMEKMTGLSRKGISKTLDILVAHGLITKIKSKTSDGDDAPNRYEINVNCIGGGRELNTLPVGNSVHQGVGNSVHPQKKDYTKEKKEPPTPRMGEAAGAACVVQDLSLKKEKKPTIEKLAVRDHVMLTPDELEILKALHGESKLGLMLDTLDSWKGSNGKQYKSDFHTLKPGGWVYKRYEEEKGTQGQKNGSEGESSNFIHFDANIAELRKNQGEEYYIAYLKKVSDKKYYNEYIKSKENK